jgi:hypothetical protein
MGIDPRGIHDKYTDYFDQDRNMAKINLDYCERNPARHAGYGADDRGITARARTVALAFAGSILQNNPASTRRDACRRGQRSVGMQSNPRRGGHIEQAL